MIPTFLEKITGKLQSHGTEVGSAIGSSSLPIFPYIYGRLSAIPFIVPQEYASHPLAREDATPSLNNLRILIADDHEIVRRGIRALLSSRPGWSVCAEASTGREAVKLAYEHKPNVVVMDIAMPGLNGIDATRQIRKMLPRTEVVILSLHYSDQLAREVVDSGARAYILKTDATSDLETAVQALASHRSFFTSGAAQILVDEFCKPASEAQPPLMRKKLSAREREIVQLLAEGKSSKEVAILLGISVKTSETHRANIMRKLEIHGVSELVRYAVKNHMIEP